ncbi:hypothetical protein MCEGE10_01367 [Flavobacteriaceae bacterium]
MIVRLFATVFVAAAILIEIVVDVTEPSVKGKVKVVDHVSPLLLDI